MSDLVEVLNKPTFDLRTHESKMELAEALLDAPQMRCNVVHRFGPGVYIREASYKAGTLIIGQEHVSDHINMLLKGKINVIDGNGNTVTLEAPHMFVSPAGSKVGYALEDVIWQNIYATNETNVEVLEQTLFKAPPKYHEYLSKQLEDRTIYHEVDRQDYREMIEECGWSAEDIEKVSHYRGDCIPFPYGSYSITQGDSPIQGKGMFATADIAEGTVIAPMRLNCCRTPAGFLVNHSKYPNAEAVLTDNGDMYLVALRDIKGMDGGFNGDEVTISYRHTMRINNLWNGDNKCQQPS